MRKIASVRIRVENALKRLKDYKIFKNTQPNRVNKKILDDMVTIACALCNLQPSLIKSESIYHACMQKTPLNLFVLTEVFLKSFCQNVQYKTL